MHQFKNYTIRVSTHSHPKVAAISITGRLGGQIVSTHSHPKVAAARHDGLIKAWPFQHTATRRWLLVEVSSNGQCPQVSTHSHPKVAAGVNRKTTYP